VHIWAVIVLLNGLTISGAATDFFGSARRIFCL
jgi:hypothetical protein